jgi:hypothetical protein
MSASGILFNLELDLTLAEGLGIHPEAMISSKVGCTGKIGEFSIRDKDNVGIILGVKSNKVTEGLPLAVIGETVPTF